jgi:hypothetical protein
VSYKTNSCILQAQEVLDCSPNLLLSPQLCHRPIGLASVEEAVGDRGLECGRGMHQRRNACRMSTSTRLRMHSKRTCITPPIPRQSSSRPKEGVGRLSTSHTTLASRLHNCLDSQRICRRSAVAFCIPLSDTRSRTFTGLFEAFQLTAC